MTYIVNWNSYLNTLYIRNGKIHIIHRQSEAQQTPMHNTGTDKTFLCALHVRFIIGIPTIRSKLSQIFHTLWG